jgi:hypothetical protein
MTAPLLPVRSERFGSLRTAATTKSASDADSDLTADQQAQLAAQHQAFDFDAAEQAEMLREHDALQAMLLENLKNEDEIMKKWIALI